MGLIGHKTRTTFHLAIIVVLFAASFTGCLGEDDGNDDISFIEGPVETLILVEDEMADIDDRWYIVDDIWSGDYHYPNSTVAAVNYWMNDSVEVVAELYIEVYWFESEEEMYEQISLALPLHKGDIELGDWSRVYEDSDPTDDHGQVTVILSEENVGLSMDVLYLEDQLSLDDVMEVVQAQYDKILDAGQ